MAKSKKIEAASEQPQEFLKTLKARFENNMSRDQGLNWDDVRARLKANPAKLNSLEEMARTCGEPDVVDFDKQSGKYIFYDCAAESPSGRRSLCYDYAAWEARKEHRPETIQL